MKRLASLIFAGLLASGAAPLAAEYPRDHLEPAESAWSRAANEFELPTIALSVFHETRERDVRLWAYSTSNGLSLDHDSMTLLRGDGSHYRIVFMRSPVVLMDYTTISRRNMHIGLQPADYRDIKPERCEIGISKTLGDRIVNVWRDSIMSARFYEKPQNPGVDAGWWVFSSRDGYRELQGQIAEPAVEGSTPDKLISLAWNMGQFCRAKTNKARAAIESGIAGFEANTPKKKHNERAH